MELLQVWSIYKQIHFVSTSYIWYIHIFLNLIPSSFLKKEEWALKWVPVPFKNQLGFIRTMVGRQCYRINFHRQKYLLGWEMRKKQKAKNNKNNNINLYLLVITSKEPYICMIDSMHVYIGYPRCYHCANLGNL